AGAVELEVHVEERELEPGADEELGEREVLVRQVGDMRLAPDPGPPDADVRREYGEAFRGGDVDPLRAHVELVDPRELGVGAAHADRGRGDAALDEGPARLAAPERDVAARHL